MPSRALGDKASSRHGFLIIIGSANRHVLRSKHNSLHTTFLEAPILYYFSLPEDLKPKVSAFASERVKRTAARYAARNQWDAGKLHQDIVVGLIGEWTVYSYYLQQGAEIDPPDMAIYENGDGWRDHTVNGRKLSVKSQNAALIKRFGASWTWNWDKPRDPELDERKGLQALCLADLDIHAGFLLGIYESADLLRPELLSLPILEKLHPFKRVRYWSDICAQFEESAA